MIYTCVLASPLGPMRAAAEEGALIGLWFEGQKYYPKSVDLWVTDSSQPLFKDLERWLKTYFGGSTDVMCKIKLAPKGTDFQQRVWDILQQIPVGETMTYGEIAKAIAKNSGKTSMSAQAVGGAVGHNPISILIPCHRVVGRHQNLTGYAGGLDKKIALLQLESALI